MKQKLFVLEQEVSEEIDSMKIEIRAKLHAPSESSV